MTEPLTSILLPLVGGFPLPGQGVYEEPALTHQNAKSRSRLPSRNEIVLDPSKDRPTHTSYYHPTKGWREVSAKRSRAMHVLQRLPVRGHAVARFIKEG